MKFTGHERDLADPSGTGDDLDYMHARFCSPLLGRFLTIDTIRSARLTIPQSWNRYSYAANNPINLVDLNGEQPAAPQPTSFQQMLSDFWDLLTSIGGSNQIDNVYYIDGEFRRVGLGAEDMAIITGTALATAAALDSAGDAEKREGPVTADGTADAASGERLQKQLANEERVSQLTGGEGESMAGAGAKKPIHDIDRLVSQYGGSPEDWAKVRSSNFTAPDGTKFEVHGYRNVKTGELQELKTKLE